jgi:putative copper export protein
MVLVLGTGVANSWLLVGIVGLVGTTYGLLLLAKLGVLVLALLVAAEMLAMAPAFSTRAGRSAATSRRGVVRCNRSLSDARLARPCYDDGDGDAATSR